MPKTWVRYIHADHIQLHSRFPSSLPKPSAHPTAVGAVLHRGAVLCTQLVGTGSLGWDWLVVDLQHGLLDYSDMVPMLQALSGTNTVPFVRVPWRDTWQIDRALDAGAMGVIVPLVNNRAHAEEVVQAMKYPNNPQTPGVRSCGPVRSMGLYGSEHMERVRLG